MNKESEIFTRTHRMSQSLYERVLSESNKTGNAVNNEINSLILDGLRFREEGIIVASLTKKQRELLSVTYKKGMACPQLPVQIRNYIKNRDSHTCVYCGMKENKAIKLYLCVDHVIPWSKGGTHDFQNLATACRICNSKKYNKTIKEWKGA